MRIGTAPAVAADRIVHRIGPVADVVAQPDHIERAVLLCYRGIRACRIRRTDAPHAHDDAIVSLDGGIRQRPGPSHVGARSRFRIAVLDLFMLLVERDHEFVA
ncbi:hypothetical protein A8V01_23215 [Novosphingobium guangzhouense]|uniref:Uncharacterized protein n=1 Tax=Novosphingobium guangzhouense TaxID=1850347 RepID=A0A2K2FXX0_9SPHN|nr:hypothetical protein A8V01_23215 [Novosphingobium guangzhouense]